MHTGASFINTNSVNPGNLESGALIRMLLTALSDQDQTRCLMILVLDRSIFLTRYLDMKACFDSESSKDCEPS